MRVPPNTEAVVVAFLRDDPDLAPLHAGRVSTQVPVDAAFPRLRITRNGGLTSADGWLDRPRIVVEAWAENQPDAWQLASTALAVLQTRLPASPCDGGVITDVRVDIGLAWAPDVDAGLARYTFAVTVTIHPTP